MGRVKRIFLIALVVAVAAAGDWWFRPGPGYTFGEFDPDAIAAIETRMWRAYYGGNVKELGQELVALLNEQFDIPLARTLTAAGHLGRAAFTFKGTSGENDKVLADLEKAYKSIRKATGASWDHRAAARAELRWWVDRRTPGQSSAENVGRNIAALYTILSGKDNAEIQRAGRLRAEAARVRDTRDDWPKVERLLRESYRSLVMGLAAGH